MITVAKATSVGYYSGGDGNGGGMESYYLDAVTEGEPAGRWLGTGARLLGLFGEVDAADMETLYEEFVNPVTGQRLGNRPADRAGFADRLAAAQAAEPDATAQRRAEIRAEVAANTRTNVIGWDLTFAVPKSITLLHTAASRGQIAAARAGDTGQAQAFGWIRGQIDEAIREANEAGLAAAETATTARAGGGTGGALRWEQAQAVVFASFYQHTNRSIEPHLHVHNVALNRVACPDGQWRAIDGQDLLARQYGFSAVADRALVESLAARLGTRFRDRADVAGKEAALIPEPVVDFFSARRQQLTAALQPMVDDFTDKYGREPTDTELSWLKTYAQRSSRDRKTHGDQTADELNDTWVAHLAATVGHHLDNTKDDLLRSVVDRLPDQLRAQLPPQLLAAVEADARRAAAANAAVSGAVAGWDGTWSPTGVITTAIARCADRSATWGRANLKLELERNLPVLGIGVDQVQEFLETLTDRALESADVVQVAGRDAGVYAPPSAALYATTGTLQAEATLRAAAVERGRHALDRAHVSAWLDAHAPTIGADQRAAVEGLASSDAALSVLVGPAATGKSFAGGALAAAWGDLTGGQGRVFGLAVSQKATEVLRDDGIPLSRNIDQWLALQDHLDTRPETPTDSRPATPHDAPNPGEDTAWALRPTDIVMVDETSMVATKDLSTIRARVDAAGARLILTGDPRQLGPIEAGGAMDLLDGHAETYTLTEVRRFSNDWERAASLALRDGDPAALDEYDRHARLVGLPTAEAANAEAARRAVADRLDGKSVLVVTGTNAQAATVAAKIRDQLIDLGLVQPDGGVLLGRDQNTATVGDVITCRRNDYTLRVNNQLQYTVLAGPGQPLHPDTTDNPDATKDTDAGEDTDGGVGGVVPDGALLVRPVPTPARPATDPILLPAGYVAADTQLGYAGTVHASQGVTVDTAYNRTGGSGRLDAAAQYVAQTRGRHLNVAIVDLATPPDASSPAASRGRGQLRVEDTSAVPTARDVLAAALTPPTYGLHHRPDPGTAATVAAERDQTHQQSMATITAQLDTETRAACRARLENHLDDLVHEGVLDEGLRARIGADQATEHLSRLLRAVEQDGRDPRATLTAAATWKRSFLDADSPAQVLAHRISRGRPDHALTAPAPTTGTAIPTDIGEPVAARLKELHARAETRTLELGRQTAQQAPDWALLALGPVPAAEDDADRADWERRAGLVAAHREAVGDTHPTRALDRMPGLTATERRAGYAAAWHALGRPDTELEEAAMSEGRLRVRIQAWEREHAWQPRYVDDQLRAAETDLHSARQAAALTQARADHADQLGDTQQAERLRVQAADQRQTLDLKAAVVDRLTVEADTYTQWVAHTAVTRHRAERARAAAEQRGIDLDTPADDVTTAQEWLTHQAERIAAEDTHRPITETDLGDVRADADDHDWNSPTPDEDLPETASPEPLASHDDTEDDTRTQPTADHAAQPSSAQNVPADELPTKHAPTEDAVEEAVDPEPVTQAQTAADHEPATQHDPVAEADMERAEPAPAVPEQPTVQEVELLASGASLALSVMADRASQEQAHTVVAQEDLAIQAAEAGRRRRELADLDATLEAVDHTASDDAGWED